MHRSYLLKKHNHNYEIVDFKKCKSEINFADISNSPWEHNNETKLEQYLLQSFCFFLNVFLCLL